jgi:hypothetical protein
MLSVDELQEPDDAGLPLIYHKLVHGTTLHGKQHYASVGNMAEFLSALGAGSAAEAAVDLASASARLESERHEPLTYYHRTGPIGQVLAERLPAIANGELAFVGLGSGTMAAYVEPGQKATFYELDSAIKRIAENPEYFTFLHDCKGTYQIVLGDARLKMEDHGRDHQYGLIVVDAFSSDAIPVHLLTKEAVELYRKRLAPGGVIALHISNRYLELKPVAARIAQELGMVALHQWDSDANAAGKQTSEWVLVANQRADFGGLTDRTYEGDDDSGNKVTLHRWSDVKPDARSPLWTDDFSNFLQIMQWKQIFKMGDW